MLSHVRQTDKLWDKECVSWQIEYGIEKSWSECVWAWSGTTTTRGKWGGVTAPQQPPTSRLHVLCIFPQLGADGAPAPWAHWAARHYKRLFCGSTAAGGGSAVKCTRSEPTTSITDRGEESLQTSTSHPLKREGKKNVTGKKRDDEEHFLYYWMGAAGNFTTRDERPKNNNPFPHPCPCSNNREVFLRTIELVLHHSRISYCS